MPLASLDSQTDTLITDEEEILSYLKNRKKKVVVVEEVALAPEVVAQKTYEEYLDDLRGIYTQYSTSGDFIHRLEWRLVNSTYNLEGYESACDLMHKKHDESLYNLEATRPEVSDRQEISSEHERTIRKKFEQMSTLYGLSDYVELEDIIEDLHYYGYNYTMKLIDDMVEDISYDDNCINDDYYD